MERPLQERVLRLERRQRLALGAALLVTAGLLLGGLRPPGDGGEVLRAARFELVDGEGALRAVLGTDADGSTGLFLHDTEGRVRLSLTHDPQQSALFIHDGQGTVRIGVAQFAHGGGGVALHGADSKGATVLYHKGTGSLSFYDEAGEVTARVPAEQR